MTKKPQENNDRKELFRMVMALVVTAVVSGFVLGFLSYITAEPIREARDQMNLEAIKEVIPSEFDNNPFEEKLTITAPDGNGEITLFPARKEGKITAIAILSHSDKGFSGKIEVMVGFLMDGTVNTYTVLSHRETPGLGTKITESKFRDQFVGLNPERDRFQVKQDGGDIDAITAATISSRAVVDAIARAYEAYNKFKTGN